MTPESFLSIDGIPLETGRILNYLQLSGKLRSFLGEILRQYVLEAELNTRRELDVDLPQPSSKIGLIRRMFLDPTASHLIITTTLGENFYLHSQTKQAKALGRLKGVSIESIAWNASLPTASTREILIGATDGSLWEIYVEPSSEFYRREERYGTQVWKTQDGAITGVWADTFPDKPDVKSMGTEGAIAAAAMKKKEPASKVSHLYWFHVRIVHSAP